MAIAESSQARIGQSNYIRSRNDRAHSILRAPNLPGGVLIERRQWKSGCTTECRLSTLPRTIRRKRVTSLESQGTRKWTREEKASKCSIARLFIINARPLPNRKSGRKAAWAQAAFQHNEVIKDALVLVYWNLTSEARQVGPTRQTSNPNAPMAPSYLARNFGFVGNQYTKYHSDELWRSLGRIVCLWNCKF